MLKYPMLCAAVAALASGFALIPKGVDAVEGNFNFGQGDYYAGGGSGRIVPLRVSRPIDGLRARAAVAGIEVLEADTDQFHEAEEAVRRADVTILVGGTSAGETHDRLNLDLDRNVNQLIANVAKVAKRTVVLAQVPGAVVMPWSSSVDAIALMFLGGQETGAAWADILFGDRAPSGKLPITLPLTDKDQIDPSEGADVLYSEGLRTGYRATHFKHVFPFGHGLTYTTFGYGEPTSYRCESQPCPQDCGQAPFCVGIIVTNTGRRDGATVAQLYVEFPPAAGEPAPILKGFASTGSLPPAGSALVLFPLYTRDISYYSAAEAWVAVDSAVAHIGESSADLRRSLSLALAP